MISNPSYCPQCGAGLEIKSVADRLRPVCPACGFIFYLNPIVAAGVLVEREGKIALVQRGVEPGRGLWGLPAGYVEVDETAEEAAVRETWEESGLRVEVEATEVRRKVFAGLTALTGKAHKDADEWTDWWNSNRDDFEPKR